MFAPIMRSYLALIVGITALFGYIFVNFKRFSPFTQIYDVPTSNWHSPLTGNNGTNVTSSARAGLNCSPVRDVYYLRVHKTGSSTLTTMLYRLAQRHDLNMVTVTEDPYPTGNLNKYLFSVPSNHTIEYNIFAEHSSLEYDAAMEVLPVDTKFIATVRSPYHHLKSIFGEWGKEIRSKLHILTTNGVETFLRGLYKLHYHEKVENMRAPLWIQNRQARTFGLAKKDFDDPDAITEFLAKTDSIFELVLVNELYDESLVLLKRRFCWDMRDIVYTSQRERNYSRKNVAPPADLVDIHKNYSAADYRLYDHYHDRLQQEISSAEHLQEEVAMFQQLNVQVSEFCSRIQDRLRADPRAIRHILVSEDALQLDPRPWGGRFDIRAFECALMKLDTWVIRNLFKIKQNPQLCTSSSIRRRLTHESVHMNIHQEGGVYVIQHLYCRPPHPRYGIPIDVLARREAYMFM